MTRVLHLSTEQNWGGGEQQVLSLVKELTRVGIQQTLLCSQGSALERACAEQTIPVRSVRRSLFSLFSWLRTLWLIARTEKIEVIHAHDSRAHGIAVLSNLGRRHPTPVVVHRRVGIKARPSLHSLWKYNHPSVRRIICISTFVRSRLNRIVLDHNKLVLIPSAIDRTRFVVRGEGEKSLREILDLPELSRLILNIGSLRTQKQQNVFIDMARVLVADQRFRGQSLFFLILGTGPARAALQQQIIDAGLSAHVRLVGFVSNVPAALAEAEVLVSTAIDEAFGNVILEAFASRVAVVASQSGGILDLIEPEVNGLVATPGVSGEFADRVGRLLLDSGLRDRLVERAYESLRKFDIAEVSEKILGVYESSMMERE